MRSCQSWKTFPVLLSLTSLLWLCSQALAADTMAQEKPPASGTSQPSLSPETRGDLLMIHHQYLEAIDAYRKAPHDSPEVWNKLGVAYHHVYALDQAKMNYQQALMLKPKYPEAINNLGAVYYAEKEYRKAVKLYRRSLKLNPRSATVYSNLGTAYFAEGKMKQGVAAYRTAFTIDPAVFGGDVGQAISESTTPEERIRLDYCLAELYAQAGMVDHAIVYLRKALDEGFNDNKRLKEDPEFASLRKTPEFAQLMATENLP